MKKIFWTGIIGLILFEIANVYFIMPMPGSQQMNSIDLAYFLYRYRWFFRILFAGLIAIGFIKLNWKKKWIPFIPLVFAAVILYMTNFKMAADAMFQQPKQLIMANAAENKVDTGRLVIGVALNGEAKAYPVQDIGYHHQVQDTLGGKPILVTYCTVCRTGRVYEPVINGIHEQFRLVGMDHFNAMIEDASTKSWWRQATGTAIAGKLKGTILPELMSSQTSLAKWIELHPQTLIMQADPSFTKQYDTTFKFESGKSKSKLTGTDSLSWKNKSWIVGIRVGKETKAYDWNELKAKRIIHDTLNKTPVLLLLAKDNKSFFAFERPATDAMFTISNDTLLLNGKRYLINGIGIDTVFTLKTIPAYQEFWHSWLSFHPDSRK
jgi:hypothetical protein